jgi:type IV fimbrial biogenesis protein FimT
MEALSAWRPGEAGAGFTLVEMLVTLAVVAVLAVVAFPSMRVLVLTQPVRAGASALQGALFFARSEAIKRATNVDVVPTGGDWRNGWEVRVTVDGNVQVLQRNAALSDRLSSMSGATISYRNDGRVEALPADIKFKTDDTHVLARCVSLDLGGRPTILYGKSSDSCN